MSNYDQEHARRRQLERLNEAYERVQSLEEALQVLDEMTQYGYTFWGERLHSRERVQRSAAELAEQLRQAIQLIDRQEVFTLADLQQRPEYRLSGFILNAAYGTIARLLQERMNAQVTARLAELQQHPAHETFLPGEMHAFRKNSLILQVVHTISEMKSVLKAIIERQEKVYGQDSQGRMIQREPRELLDQLEFAEMIARKPIKRDQDVTNAIHAMSGLLRANKLVVNEIQRLAYESRIPSQEKKTDLPQSQPLDTDSLLPFARTHLKNIFGPSGGEKR